LSLAAVVHAQPRAAEQCFYPTDWNGGWRAARDSRAIYVRVRMHDIYRLDLTAACPELQEPDAHLILKLRGPAIYCTALDFDLSVAETPPGIAVPCIVSRMTQLTPSEAAALPKDLRP
jgi:hypothetical protein